VICANLYVDGERLFPACTIKMVNGNRVCIFALLGEQPRDVEGVEVRDPGKAGEDALYALAGQDCDLIILLAHMESEKLRELLPRLEDVDLVIRGHAPVGSGITEDCADTLGGSFEDIGVPVVFAGDRGRALGRIALIPAGEGNVTYRTQSALYLDGTFEEDRAMAAELKTFTEEEGRRFREMRMKEFLARDEVSGRIKERYLGFDICMRCHADLLPRFVESRHFRAFGTLELREETENPKCLPCHTTGYGRFSGYDSGNEAKEYVNLRGVQCEACHGPGTGHARDGTYVEAAWQSCRGCHTTAWSPDFDEETYWKRSAHCGRWAREQPDTETGEREGAHGIHE
jgi:hypothetical protein